MSTTLTPESATEVSRRGTPGSKTLSVKNIPHAVWQRARQHALASNLSFGDYVVKVLETAGPIPLPEQSAWDNLLPTGSHGTHHTLESTDTHTA